MRCFATALTLSLALFCTANAQVHGQPDPARTAACTSGANELNLNRAPRDKFFADCMRGETAGAREATKQQYSQRMHYCDVTGRQYRGLERQRHMDSCLTK